MKHLILVITALFFIVSVSGFVTYGAQEQYAVEVTDSGVAFKGRLGNVNAPVMIIVTFKADEDADLEAYPDKIKRVLDTVTDADGNFTTEGVPVVFGGGEWYTARFRPAKGNVKKLSFYIPTDDERAEIYTAFVPTKNSADMNDFLNRYGELLSLDMTALRALRRPDTVIEGLLAAKSAIKNTSGIVRRFQELLSYEQETEREEDLDADAIAALNGASSVTLDNVLNAYNDRYKLNLTDRYGYGRIIQEKINGNPEAFNLLLAGITPSVSMTDLRERFENITAALVFNLVGWQDKGSVITAHSSAFYALNGGAFKSIHSTEQAEIYRKADDMTFSNIEGIVSWLNAQAKPYLDRSVLGTSGSGGSGGQNYHAPPSVPGNLDNIENAQISESASNMPFDDLYDVPWAVESIRALAKAGVVSGTGAGLFMPNELVKREEFIKMLVLAFGMLRDDAIATFEDVTKDDWFYPYIASGQTAGIVTGFTMTHFGTGQNVSRQDAATLCYRAAKIAGAALSDDGKSFAFEDGSVIAEYAIPAVDAMQKAGIINGVGDGLFEPESAATRAQAAKIVAGIIQFVNNK